MVPSRQRAAPVQRHGSLDRDPEIPRHRTVVRRDRQGQPQRMFAAGVSIGGGSTLRAAEQDDPDSPRRFCLRRKRCILPLGVLGREFTKWTLRGQMGHQCSIAPGDRSPSYRYLSQTSAGKGLSSLLHHRRPLISTVPWFVLTAVPSSRPSPSTCDAHRRGQGRPARAARRAWPRRRRARRDAQTGRGAARASLLVASKPRPLASTAQAIRASLLASAIASTLWCSRFFAASIHDLSP